MTDQTPPNPDAVRHLFAQILLGEFAPEHDHTIRSLGLTAGQFAGLVGRPVEESGGLVRRVTVGAVGYHWTAAGEYDGWDRDTTDADR
jgi:hypothetical protein